MATKASGNGSSRPKESRVVAKHHAADLSFLGAAPLIPGERAADYERLLAAVTDEIKPAEPVETIWTRDFVDLQWDIIRFRRIKADLITHRGENCPWATDKSNGTIADIVAININVIERIDRMVMTMEARRNAAYHEVERHRIGLGERLRHAVEQVEDAEFRDVDETTSLVPHDTTDKDLAEPTQRAR
jgi:hypothetical protein